MFHLFIYLFIQHLNLANYDAISNMQKMAKSAVINHNWGNPIAGNLQ